MSQIYLDYNASTPIDPRVRQGMSACEEGYGNPSSTHWAGEPARRIVEQGRARIAALLGCSPGWPASLRAIWRQWIPCENCATSCRCAFTSAWGIGLRSTAIPCTGYPTPRTFPSLDASVSTYLANLHKI